MNPETLIPCILLVALASLAVGLLLGASLANSLIKHRLYRVGRVHGYERAAADQQAKMAADQRALERLMEDYPALHLAAFILRHHDRLPVGIFAAPPAAVSAFPPEESPQPQTEPKEEPPHV
jgi:hypothetical protein